MRIHLVFHVSLLEHATDDPFPGQRADPPPPVEVDGEEEYHVYEILDFRTFGRWRNLQFQVKWAVHDRPTREDPGIDGLQAIDRFHALTLESHAPSPSNQVRSPELLSSGGVLLNVWGEP